MGEEKPTSESLDAATEKHDREEAIERRVDAVKNAGNVVIDAFGDPLLTALEVPPHTIAGMKAGMKAAFSFTVGVFGRKAKRNAARLVEGAVSAAPAGTTAEQVVEQIRERTDKDPELEDDVYDLIQRALAAIDVAVVPALGRLLYHHTHGTLCNQASPRSPRRVFRGAARLLCELDAEQYRKLHKMVRPAAEAEQGSTNLPVRADAYKPEGVTLGKLLLHFDLVDETQESRSAGGVTPIAPDVTIHGDVAKALWKVTKDG